MKEGTNCNHSIHTDTAPLLLSSCLVVRLPEFLQFYLEIKEKLLYALHSKKQTCIHNKEHTHCKYTIVNQCILDQVSAVGLKPLFFYTSRLQLVTSTNQMAWYTWTPANQDMSWQKKAKGAWLNVKAWKMAFRILYKEWQHWTCTVSVYNRLKADVKPVWHHPIRNVYWQTVSAIDQ